MIKPGRLVGASGCSVCRSRGGFRVTRIGQPAVGRVEGGRHRQGWLGGDGVRVAAGTAGLDRLSLNGTVAEPTDPEYPAVAKARRDKLLWRNHRNPRNSPSHRDGPPCGRSCGCGKRCERGRSRILRTSFPASRLCLDVRIVPRYDAATTLI